MVKYKGNTKKEGDKMGFKKLIKKFKKPNKIPRQYKNTRSIQLIDLKSNRTKTSDYFVKMGYEKYEDYPDEGLTLEDIEKQFNELIEAGQSAMEQLRNSHQTIPTSTYQKRRDEINNGIRRVNNAYKHINNEQALNLRNAICEISKRSENYKLDYPKEELKKTKRKIVDLHVFPKDNVPSILDTEYLKVNRIANIAMDMTDGTNASVDGSLSKFKVYVPSLNGKTGKTYTSYLTGREKKTGQTYTCYISGLDEEQLKYNMDYQKVILQGIEKTILEKAYPYIGKIEKQKDGNYVIKKVGVQKEACLIVDGILLEKKRKELVREEEEKWQK